MELWHAGFAVKDLEEAIETWEGLGFKVAQKFEKDEPAAHAALMIDKTSHGVELWQFTGDSELNKFIGRHVAFKCDDVNKTSAYLKEHGFSEVIPYTKGVIVNYIFLQDSLGTYFELAEVKEGTW